MEKLTLFKYDSPDSKTSIKIYFNEQNQLVVDGYDIGKTTEEIMGDSDYEYIYTIEWDEVKKIAGIFGLDYNDRLSILKEIQQRFNEYNAFSKFGKFMDENGIVYKEFYWR